MPRLKFLDSKSIVQVFEETLAELWQAIKQEFWEVVATYRLKHSGAKVSKETREKARIICKRIKKDLEEK